MEYRHFQETDRRVGRFVDNMARGISNIDPRGRRFYNVEDANHPDIEYDDEEIEVFVTDSKRTDIGEDFFEKHLKVGDMFILILNINPNTLSGDAESEVRFWMDDSMKVINDRRLPDDVKLKSLPGREYGLIVGDKTVFLSNCKMVQNYSKKNSPFNFAIIVEKSYIRQ